MVKIRIGDETVHTTLKAKVRLDFKGIGRSGRFLFGGKNTERLAEETREQQTALLRNVPIQGIAIENIDMSQDIYVVTDDVNNQEAAYAPVVLDLVADGLEDVIRFIARDEFRKIEIIEPPEIYLSKHDMERLLFKMNQEIKGYREHLEKKLSYR
ncbi:MAG: hypothetical protein ACYDG6_07235 [Thermincolia bacterium]